MKKSDIKNGMHVITNNGDEYIIISGVDAQNQTTSCKIAMISTSDGWMPLDEYDDDDLRYIDDDDDDDDDSYDIKEVYAPKYYAHILHTVKTHKTEFVQLWKRPIPKKMTKAEIEKALGYEIEIIKD